MKLDGTTGSTFDFFRLCATLFSKLFLSPKGTPFKCFDTLQQTEVSKSPKGLPFLVFRLFETVSIVVIIDTVLHFSHIIPSDS